MQQYFDQVIQLVNSCVPNIIGSITITTAITFGIGGRDIAAQKLNEWTKKL